MSNKKIKGEAVKRAAVKATGRKPGPLQWLHEMYNSRYDKKPAPKKVT